MAAYETAPELEGFVPPVIPKILPHEKVFSIQVGNELFRLSGASLSSDAPSYFTKYFLKELEKLTEQEQEDANVLGLDGLLDGHMIPQREVKTLYIDRDPSTFRDIANHLQGYFVRPTNPTHYVRLLSDAQFYTLPRLLRQLHSSDICVNIGGTPFTIPRDSFLTPGNDANFFTIGLDINFNPRNDLYPSLDRTGLLRPPSLEPPYLPNRDPTIFLDLLRFLRGYPIHVTSPDHREDLLRDARYYGFRALEQSLIPHSIAFNPRLARDEIVLRIEDLKKAGFHIIPLAFTPAASLPPTWLCYARPFTGELPRDLVVEVCGYSMRLNLAARRAAFSGDTGARVAALFQIIAEKLEIAPTTGAAGGEEGGTGEGKKRRLGLAESGLCGGTEWPKIRIERDCYILLDGEEFLDCAPPVQGQSPSVQGQQQQQQQQQQQGGYMHLYPPSAASSEQGSSMEGVQSPSSGIASPSVAASMQGMARRRNRKQEDSGEWVVKRGQWRIRIQDAVGPDGKVVGKEAVFVGVKIEAVTGEWGRNSLRTFLN